MEPKIFYRIENNGNGPYNFIGWMETDHEDEGHPGPRTEICKNKAKNFFKEIVNVFGYSSNALYAFESINKFMDWFTFNEIANLFELGFSLVKIISDEYVLGEKQDVFHKDHFECIDSISTWKEFENRIFDF